MENTTLISFDTESNELVENTPVDIIEHEVDEYYEMIPAYYSIDGVGIVNRNNPIKVTEYNSVIVYDNQEKTLKNLPISDIRKEPKRYFYILGSVAYDLNDEAYFQLKDQEYQSGIKLEHITGFMLGVYLKHRAGIPIVASSKLHSYLTDYKEIWSKWMDIEFDFYKKTYNSSMFEIKIHEIYEKTPFWDMVNTVIIDKYDGMYTIANEIIYSSNKEFIVGLLESLIFTEKIITQEISELLVHEKIAINVYTNILNYLFADYKIMHGKYKGYPPSISFSIEFELAPAIFNMLKIANSKIRKKIWTWKIDENGEVKIEQWQYKCNPEQANSKLIAQLIHLKENNKIKFIRADEMITNHIRCREPIKLYDLVMGAGNSNNYLLMSGIFAKNSDGDILTLMGLMSEESIQAAKEHSLTSIKRMKDALNPDEVNNWIQKDAVGGLYVATKEG